MKKVILIATSIFGVEALVRKELIALGFNILATHDGRVEFEADYADIPRANLWLRHADRVLLKVGEFKAEDFDQLFDTVKSFPWKEWITKDGKIDIMSRCVKSQIHSARTCQSMVKKAIIENLRKSYKIQWFEESGPAFTVHANIYKDTALISIDTTGSGLHKRGYRLQTGEVPLRENLAASLIHFTNWNTKLDLVDPMCGSGTLLIEAAMKARNIAPGLNRQFVSEEWPWIKKALWDDARLQAKEAIKKDVPLRIFGYDISPQRIKDARSNAKRAGVFQDITFAQTDINDLKLEQTQGIIISNPPYGIKLMDRTEVLDIYSAIDKLGRKNKKWFFYILTADKGFANHFSRSRPRKVRRLFHGTLQVDFFQYFPK